MNIHTASGRSIVIENFLSLHHISIKDEIMHQIIKTLLASLTLIFLCYQINAQEFWEQLNTPSGSSIFSITVDDDGVIFLGKGDGVYSSDNNGLDWEYLGPGGTIYSINYYKNTVYAGFNLNEYFSGFYNTTNGGNSWDTLNVDLEVYGNIVTIVSRNDTILISTWDDIHPNLLFTNDPDTGWRNILNLENHEGEHVSDIILTEENTIYASLYAYYPQRGGVIKSTNFGQTWEFTGLLNHMVSSLAMNSNKDLFAGVWSHEQGAWPGVYVLRNGSNTWDTLIIGPYINDLVIMANNDIYCTSMFPNGVIRSEDDGVTFELINEGLPSGLMDDIIKDNEGYIYVTDNLSVSKSLNPIVSTEIIKSNKQIFLFPNPAKNHISLFISNMSNNATKNNLIISDIYGKFIEISVINNENGILDLDIEKLKPGIFFITINNENYSQTLKFIKH